MVHSARRHILLHSIAAGIFVGMTLFEVAHDVSGSVWPGYGINYNYVVLLLAPLWLGAAVSCFMRGFWADMLLFWGCAAMLTQGAMIRIGTSQIGYLYMGFAVISFLLSVPTRHLARPGKKVEAQDHWEDRQAA